MHVCGCLNSSVDFPGNACSKEPTCQCKRHKRHFPGGSDGKESTCNVGDLGSIPGFKRSPGEGNSYPFYYSCLQNSMDRGDWQAPVHGVAKSWTRVSDSLHSKTPQWTSQVALVVKHLLANARDIRDAGPVTALIQGIQKIPWRRAWQPTLVFLPGESHGQRSLAG